LILLQDSVVKCSRRDFRGWWQKGVGEGKRGREGDECLRRKEGKRKGLKQEGKREEDRMVPNAY